MFGASRPPYMGIVRRPMSICSAQEMKTKAKRKRRLLRRLTTWRCSRKRIEWCVMPTQRRDTGASWSIDPTVAREGAAQWGVGPTRASAV